VQSAYSPSAVTTGNHPIQQVQTLVGSRIDGSTTNATMMTRTTEWTAPNSAATIISLAVFTSLDGLRQWSIAYPGAPCQQVTRTVTQYGVGTKTVTITFTDNSTQVSISTNVRHRPS
jgi:hypothetical protein